ncbi:MAG: LPXTG cell wall anchor domain-containing protein, partial [Thermoactinomyces sp.]
LKPSIEYCFNIKVGAKALKLVDLNVKAFGEAGNLVCVKTKKPGEQPGNPDPQDPGKDNPGTDNPGTKDPGDNNNGGNDTPGNNGGDDNGKDGSKDDGKNGGKLPKTASPYANNIVIGASLLAAGLGALALRRRMA